MESTEYRELRTLIETGFAQVNVRLDRHEQLLVAHDARLKKHEARFDQHGARFDRLEARLDQHDARFDRLDAISTSSPNGWKVRSGSLPRATRP